MSFIVDRIAGRTLVTNVSDRPIYVRVDENGDVNEVDISTPKDLYRIAPDHTVTVRRES